MKKKFKKWVQRAHQGKPGSTKSGKWYSPGYLSIQLDTESRPVSQRAPKMTMAARITTPAMVMPAILPHWPRVRSPMTTGSRFFFGFSFGLFWAAC